VSNCSFKTKYWNFDSNEETLFECPERIEPGTDKCIFHSVNSIENEEHRKKVQNRFGEKIEDYLSNKYQEPFFCIGYRLHDVRIEDKEFPNPVYFDEVNISGGLTINSKFLNHVSFSRGRFSGLRDIDFRGAQFSGEGVVDFSHAHFSGESVFFSDVQFLGPGKVTFSGTHFSGEGDIDFARTQFSGAANVYFVDSQFSGKGNVSFSGAQFSAEGDVDFTTARFSGKGNVSFSGAQFLGKGNVSFRDTQFSGVHVIFSGAKFLNEGDVSFYHVKFLNEGSVFFSGAQFLAKGNIIFSDAQFLGKGVSFNAAEFSNEGGVSFWRAKFLNEGGVFFTRTQFSGKGGARFTLAQFLNDGDVSFYRVKFLNEGYVSFAGVEFSINGNVDFISCQFMKEGGTDFTDANFNKVRGVYFNGSKFSGMTSFLCQFTTDVFFRSVNFMSPNEVRFEPKDRFETEDLSSVSFSGTDITRILFPEDTLFGNLKQKNEEFKIFDERKFVEYVSRVKNNVQNIPETEKVSLGSDVQNIPETEKVSLGSDVQNIPETEKVSLGSVLASYRNLRENYEFRLRYDDAGQFFVREMEIKRKYREKLSIGEKRYIPKKNCWFRRNFSLTGLYYHLSRYGESISRPIILAGIIVGLSTLFWLMQNNPTGEPSISYNAKTLADNFINFTQFSNNTHTLKAFERSLADFLPLLSMPSDTKIGIIDFIVKIVGGGLTFVLLGLALRRKFERKYTR